MKFEINWDRLHLAQVIAELSRRILEASASARNYITERAQPQNSHLPNL